MKRRTTIEIDEKLLKEAMEMSGCSSKTEVVNRALHELVRAHGLRAMEEFIREGRTLELPYYEEDKALEGRRSALLERLWNGEDPPR